MKILPDSNCMLKLQPPEHPKILQERFRDVICGLSTAKVKFSITASQKRIYPPIT